MARRGAKQTRRRSANSRGQDSQARILDAAESQFAKNGYGGARTQEIADTAGVTKAMIHYYFGSKERLFRAVLDRILFELIKLVQEVTSSETSRVVRFDAFMRGFFDYAVRHPNLGRLTFLVGGEERPYFDNIVEGFFRPLFARGVAFIEEGIADGSFRQVDAPHFLLAIYATTMEYLADARFVTMVLEQDAMGPLALHVRKEALMDMAYRTLGVEPPARRR